MEKAYDLKVLGEKLKADGLVEAEDMAEKVYSAVKGWLKESAQVSKTPFDNLAFNFLDQLDSMILPQIDKIDGQEG